MPESVYCKPSGLPAEALDDLWITLWEKSAAGELEALRACPGKRRPQVMPS